MSKVFASIILVIVLATPTWAFDDLAPVTMKKLIDANHLEAGLGRIYLEEKLDALTDKVDAIPIAVPMQLHMDEMDSFNTLLTHAEERIHLLQVAISGLSRQIEDGDKADGVEIIHTSARSFGGNGIFYYLVGTNLIKPNLKLMIGDVPVVPLYKIQNVSMDFTWRMGSGNLPSTWTSDNSGTLDVLVHDYSLSGTLRKYLVNDMGSSVFF